MHYSYSKTDDTLFLVAWLRQGLLLITLLGGLQRGYAQNEQKFEHLSTSQGLSQSVVNCVWQDSRGFMWFGTQAGLNKYDGYEMTVYTHDESEPKGISGDNVQCLYEDREGFLWIGTINQGLSRYNRKTDTFESFFQNAADPKSIADNTVLAITQDQAGRIWLGTRRGLQLFNPETGLADKISLNQPGASSTSEVVTALLEDKSGFLWVGTENGLVQLDKNRKVLRMFQNQPEDSTSLSNNEVRCIFQDKSDILYVGTSEGLNRYNPRKNAFDSPGGYSSSPNPLSLEEIYSLADDGKGNLWIGTFGSGLVKLNKKTNAVHSFTHLPADPESLSSDVVLSSWVDRSGLLWVGTYGSGVDKVDMANVRFEKLQRVVGQSTTLPSNEIYAIYQDRNRLWLGTDNGLSCLDQQTGQFMNLLNEPAVPTSLSSNTVYNILADHQKNIWVGTAGGGLNLLTDQLLQKKAFAFQHFNSHTQPPYKLLSDYVLSLLEDQQGRLWIGTNAGMNVMDRNHRVVQSYTYQSEAAASLSNNEVLCIFQDRQGIIWIGTNRGLNRFNPEAPDAPFTRYLNQKNNPASLLNNTVYTIYEDRKGVLWLGTDGGLCSLNPERTVFSAYTLKDGLPDNVVYGILEDEDQNLWLSTNKGLSKARKQPRVQKLTFVNYNTGNWLHCNTFNIGAYHRSPAGTLFFGCSEGLVYFKPRTISGNQYVPPVVLTDFQLKFNPVPISSDGESPLSQQISETRRIVLDHQQNVLYFEFAALNFIQSDKNEYAYLMEGYDKDWNYIKQRRNATYTNLDPGTYTFRVKAANNDGVWNEQGTALEIIITPPFYQEAWFYVLCALAFTLALAAFVRHRTRELQRNERILTQKVKERTEEVSRQKEELEATLDNLKATQTQLVEAEKMASLGLLTAGVAHEINNPINFVSANIEPLRRDIADMLEILARYERIIKEKSLHGSFGEVEELKKELDYQFLIQEIHQLIEGIREGSYRTSEIVKGLRNFSRMDENERKPVDVNQGIESTLLVLGSQLKNRITVVKEFEEVNEIVGYPGKLNQVFMNIITNASQAITDQGEIRVRTYMQGNRVAITIQDNGLGMPEEVKKHIFEPFFTTKQVGKGTGLGLSISYGIIKDHKGSISVESEPGKGSTFTILLPSNGKQKRLE